MEFQHFRDRADAGAQLARRLQAGVHDERALVLALPRGGVPVGFEVAKLLQLPLDVLVVRKLGLPGHEEFAMGALAGNGMRVMSEDVVRQLHISPAVIEQIATREAAEIVRREQLYRQGRPALPWDGRCIILVDDGLATGATMRAAVRVVKATRAVRVLVAVPVGSRDACDALAQEADEVICLFTPMLFRAVGEWYAKFEQTSDEEVRALLAPH